METEVSSRKKNPSVTKDDSDADEDDMSLGGRQLLLKKSTQDFAKSPVINKWVVPICILIEVITSLLG